MKNKKNKNPAAVELGKKGGKARQAKLTPEERRELGKKGMASRWGKKGKNSPTLRRGQFTIEKKKKKKT